MNMVKVLSIRFQQPSGPFTMLLVEESSETGLFRHLPNHDFWSHKFKNTSAMRIIFFLTLFKIESHLAKCKKESEKVLFFWDNCIWRCSNKLSLLRRQYLSSIVKGLTNSRNVFHMSQRDFFYQNCLHRDQWINEYDKGPVVQISTVLRPVYHVTCQRVLWNWTF